MAHSRSYPASVPAGRSGGAAPWAAFVLGMVVVLAAIAAFLFATGQVANPLRAVDVKVQGPSLPDMKMPGAPPMPRG